LIEQREKENKERLSTQKGGTGMGMWRRTSEAPLQEYSTDFTPAFAKKQ